MCLFSVSFLTALLAAPAHAADGKPVYPPLPEAFSSFGAAVSDGFVYVYGGHVGKTHTYSTEAVTGKFRRLNLANPAKGWEELPHGSGLQGLALVAHGGKVYRIGGMQPRNKAGEKADNISVASCSVFDPKTGKWEASLDLPAGRSSHDAAVVGDKLVVVGGWEMHGQGKKSNWHGDALVLDLSRPTLKWEIIAQPFQRRALNVAAVGENVYVVGGMNSDNEAERTVDVLDLKAGKWFKVSSLPGISRNGFSPAACGSSGKVYVSPSDGNLYRLSAKGDSWEKVGGLEKKRIVHRIVPVRDDVLLVLGGAGKGANIADLEVVDATRPLTSLLPLGSRDNSLSAPAQGRRLNESAFVLPYFDR